MARAGDLPIYSPLVVVPRFRPFLRLLVPVVALLAAVRCGGGDVTLPEEGLPTAIAIMEGDGQSGVVGVRIPDSLIVRVTDARQRPVRDQRVAFLTIAGGQGADLIPDTAVTDADGRARSVWVLGTLAGAQRVEARVVATGTAGLLKATFNATALAAAADTVFAAGGANQTGTVGSLLPDSLAVLVTDRFGNPIAGAAVAWDIPGGQGSLSATSTTTGADGRSAVTRRLGTSAGAQTTTATVAGVKGSPVTFAHTATAAGAVRLVKLHGDNPPQTAPAGFQLTDSLVVQAQDGNGNGVPGLSVIWVVTTPGGGSVTAQSSVTDAQGRAFTFWNLAPVAGPNTLTAAVTGLTQVQFTATGTSAQPAAIQAQSAVAQNGTAGQPVAAPPSVKVTDQNNNPVAGVTVTFLVTQGGGSVSDGAASGGSASVATSAAGIATLSSWTLGTAAGSNTLTATAAGSGIAGNPVSFTATGNPGAATQIVITVQPPAQAQSGVTLSTQPAVRLEDAHGNPVAQNNVSVTAQITGGGATLRGTTTVTTNASGAAGFSGLDVFGPVGSYSLRFSATGLVPDTSTAVALSAGPAAQLGVSTQPSATAASGVPLAQQPAIQVRDGAGNPVAQGGITVTAAIASGAGALSGTLTAATNAAGLASFTDLTITGAAGSRTLGFSAPGLAGATSTAVVVGSGAATTLSLTTQPSPTTQSGSVLAVQPVIQLRDGSGNAVAQAGVSVSVTVSTGATLGGTTTVLTDAQGEAAFAGLSLSGPSGSYTLGFSAGGLAGVTSNAIVLAAGSGTRLSITTQPPASSASGAVLVPAPVVQLRDAANNPVLQAGVNVTATIATGAGGSLGGATTVATDANGVATFSNLSISGPVGSYTLDFGGAGLTGATSTAVSLGAGSAARLRILVQPSTAAQSGIPFTTQPSLQVEDAAGNPVAQALISVTAAIASGGGTLGGTTALSSDALGQVAFTDLAISGLVGTRTLSFSATGLTSATSGAIGLSAGSAAALALHAGDNQTAVAGSPLPVSPTVKVTDLSGNPVGGVTVNFEVTAGGGSVGSPSQVTDGAGLAADTWTLGTTAGTNTLIAFVAFVGGADTVSFTATGTVGSAGQLALLTQPSATAASGVAFAQQPRVQLQDVNGNPVSTNGVAIQATPSNGSLGGNTIALTSNGVATFTNLSLTGLVGSYTLTFSAPGQSITGITSAAIVLSAGAANRLAVVTQPGGGAQSGIVLPQQPVIQVQDAAGNNVASAARVVTAAINGGVGSVDPAGRQVSTNASGTATFTALRITGPTGTYSLLFTTPGLLSDSSASFTLAAGPPASVAANSSVSQSAPAGTAVASPPSVVVRDGAGNPVPGVTVDFLVTAGGGSLNGASQVTDQGGVATVTGWTLGVVAGANSVTATVSGSGISGNPVSFSATGTATAATDIVLNGGNNQTGTVGAALAVPPSVKVTDANGNPVAGTAVTFAVTSGGGSVTGASATSNASGIATVGSWTLGTLAGVNGLSATAAGLNGSPVSFTATGVAGPAATLAKAGGDNQSATAGTAVAVPPSVLVTDQFGNPKAGTSVTFAVASGGGSVVPTTAVATNASGIAAPTSWTLGNSAGTNTLTATATGLGGSPATFTATGTAGVEAKLVLTTAPSSAGQSGVALPTQPVVRVTDALGNPVPSPGRTVTATLASGSGTLAGASVVTDAQGVAAFTGLSITGVAGAYALSFDAPPLTPVVSGTITLGAGTATQLVLDRQPSASGQSGVAFATQPRVQLQDATGNNVSQAGVTVTVQVASGPGGSPSLANASAVTNGSGLATFSGLALTGLAGSYTLQFDAPGLTSVVSNGVTLSAGAASTISITVQPPPSAASGAVFTPNPVIQLRDAAGNAVSQSGLTIVASIATGPGGTLAGTSAVTNSSGTATFTGLSLTGPAGNYTLNFTSAFLGATVTSGTVTIGAGAPSKLAVSIQPSGTVQSGIAFPVQPVIQLQDASGNNVATAGVVVGVSVFSGSATLSPLNPTATTNASGQATFSGLTLTGTIGANTLTFSAPSYVGVNSNPVTVTAGNPSQLSLITQPSAAAQSGIPFPTQPVVQLLDQSGNAVSQSGVNVTAAIFSGGGTLGGTATVATGSNGQAAFAGLSIAGTVGTRTLRFTSGALTAITSGSIVVSAGTPQTIAVSAGAGQSATVATAVAIAPAVLVTDGSNNPVSGVSVTFAVASGGGSATGTSATTNASGIATVGSWTLGNVAGSNTLTATSGTLAGSPVTFTATGVAGAATHLAMVTQPSAAAQSGVVLAVQPSVRLEDQFNNVVAQNGVAVTAAIASGGGALSGTLATSTNGSGVATFTGLTITGLVGTRTLSFTSGSLTAATSAGIVVSAGPAATIVSSAGNGQSATVGTSVAVAPAVLVTDASNNPVSGVSVTFAVASGGGSATGTSTTTNASGIAAVGSWTLGTTAGSNTLTATSSGLAGSPVTFAATGTAGAATQIAVNAGNNQSATVNTAVTTAPSVVVRDANNNPVSGVSVTFAVASGGGTVNPVTAVVTNTSGVAAVTSWTLGTVAGVNTLTATATGLTGSPLTFTATGNPGAATTLSKTAGDAQTAVVGSAVSVPPQVRVTDAFGNGVSGVSVTYAVTTGGGTVVPATAIPTSSTGFATLTSWTLGAVAGANSLTASAPSLTSVVFTATGVAGSASKLAFTTAPSAAAQSGVPFGTQPVIQVQDANGNPVSQSGLTIAATISAGTGGSLANATAVTNGSGVASFSGLTLSGTAGAFTLSYATGGLTAVSAGVTLSAGPATTIAMSAGNNQTAVAGSAVATPPAVLITDNGGNPVSGVGVTFAVAGGGGSLTGGSATSNASGIATVGSWTLGTTAGSNTLTATSAGLTGSPVSFTATGVAGAATQIAINAGNGQTAVAGTTLPTAPSVVVRDVNNNPVSGVSVTFAVTGGGGSATGTSATTNAGGIATVGSWTLGTAAGSNTLSATSTGLSGSPVTFTATGTAGAATQIAVNAGNGQSAAVGTAVATPPSVIVRDVNNNPVSGVSVTFAVAGGGGSATGTSATTNASGIATGTTAGSNSLTATSTGLSGSPVTFTATGTAGAATHLAIVTQPAASAQSGVAFTTQPSVRLEDQFNNLVPSNGVGVVVAIASGGGTLQGTTTVNTSGGVAGFAGLAISGTVGSRTLSFTSTGLTGVTSAAISVTAGPAATIALNAGNNQSATVGTAVAVAPSVLVTDASGNPVSGVSVSFAVASGGGSGTGLSATTDGLGIATVGSWTLGTTAGTNTLTASSTGLGGSPVTFTATGTAGPATQIAVNAGNGQTAAVGTAVATPPSVLVRDVFNNPVSGVAVAWAVASGGGAVVVGTGGTSNSSGIAAVTSWTLGTSAGANTLTATSTGLGGSPVTFTATGTAGSATQIAANAGDGQNATVGTAVPTPPSVIVRDANNNPVSGVSVTFAVTGGGGSVTGSGATTNASGIATVGSWTLGTAAGSNTLTATATGLSGSPVTFTATGTAGAAASVAVSAGNNQSAPIGTAVAVAPSVLVTDGFGNPVNLVSVTFAVTGGGGSVTGATTSTNASGIATLGSWTLGTTSGSNTLSATAAGVVTPASFTATATAGATTTLITSTSPDPSVSGQSVTVSVSVTASVGTPTGTVSVTDGASAASCTVTLSAGSGSCAMALAAAGARTITAVYNGDANYAGSSDTDPHTVNLAATTTTITAHTPDPATVGTAYTVNFSVAVSAPGAGAPTGNVTVSDGTGGSCVAGAGTGTCQLTSTSTGTKTLTATYAGDANFQGSVSAGVSHVVDPIATTTTITSVSPASIVLGEQTTVSFTVSGGATGNVTVGDGSVSCVATVAAGSCSFTPTSAGAKVVTATYAGDATHAGSSDTDALTVAAFGAPNAGQTTAQVPATGQVAVVTVSTVQLRDALGNLITTSGGNIIAASITSGPNTGASFVVTDNTDGTYTLEYLPLFGSGTDTIEITLSGTPIGGSPYSSTIP